MIILLFRILILDYRVPPVPEILYGSTSGLAEVPWPSNPEVMGSIPGGYCIFKATYAQEKSKSNKNQIKTTAL